MHQTRIAVETFKAINTSLGDLPLPISSKKCIKRRCASEAQFLIQLKVCGCFGVCCLFFVLFFVFWGGGSFYRKQL